MPTVLEVNGLTPTIAATAFVADNAVIAGDVDVGERASIWFGCTIRSEHASISIGPETNIQDLTVMHTDAGQPTSIGARVTVGHRAILHGCTIEDDALIGMGAIIMNGAVVEAGAVVGAGAVVTEGTRVPAAMVAVGIPARVIEREVPPIPRRNVVSYVELAQLYGQARPTER